ncbi:MAG: AAA family ATPase [Bacteroidia bacterium]|nr:AAA family ATPase [Bacteroidia bacterium]
MYLFNAKIENPEKLEQMLVGREHIVNILVDAQLKHAKGGMPPQFLVVGPRGSGKTHMLRIIYERLSKNAEYMAMHEIAYMVEDETGIGSYFDLLQRVFEALKRWSNDDQKTRYIIEQVENLKEIHSNEWTKSAENILLNILKDKSLLILIENFDAIMRGMDKKYAVIELARLRDFIQQHNQLSFIATSQSLINSLSDDQNPLYGFFNVIQLKRLTLDESREYITKIASSENNEELLQFLETHDGKGHLEAIHQFTKGNHRLLLVFFDFLKAEFRSNLSDVFLKSIDELKPYYDSFLKSLAPQQQKIVQYLSLQRNPQKGADIGRNCFLDKSTVSKQLSELQRLGYINPVNEKGRDKYYEISEPLLRMCISGTTLHC